MIDLKEYGYQGESTQGSEAAGLLPARITAVHRGMYQAVCAHGEVNAALRGRFLQGALSREELPTVGDFVLLHYLPEGPSQIERVLPRKSKFSRPDYLGHLPGYAKNIVEQLVAANFDYVFILASLNCDFSIRRLQRYLSTAWQSGGEPVLVLTKADLCPDYERQLSQAHSVAGGAAAVAVSSVTGQGLEQLSPYLRPGVTLALLGSSGVGKSSLVNALAGCELMEVGEIREEDSRGRHTTTLRKMLRLPCGALVIDTPGMRELGLWDQGGGVSRSFSEVEDLMLRCRFSDCGHNGEPGCAVEAALESGELPRDRWEDYLGQKRETAFVDKKVALLRSKQERGNKRGRRPQDNKRRPRDRNHNRYD